MTIILIRHTRVKVVPGLCYGQSDIPIADTFEEESCTILRKLHGFDISKAEIISSPLSRCTRLADKISARYRTDSRLMELDFGEWELQSWDSVDRQKSDYWMEDFVNRRCPQGESYSDMENRVQEFFHQSLSGKSDPVILVTHSGVIRIFHAWASGCPLKDTFNLKVEYGDIFTIESIDGRLGKFEKIN